MARILGKSLDVQYCFGMGIYVFLSKAESAWRHAVITQIELRQLRYFATVAEMASFGKAAKVLHISQPPLSRQVRSLELSMGVVLLKRSPVGVSLTPAGAVFLAEVQRILKRIQHAVELARTVDEPREPAA